MKSLPVILFLLVLGMFTARPKSQVSLPIIFGSGQGEDPAVTPTPVTPTATLPPGSLPVLENPGFEAGETGWGIASDNYTNLITDDNPYRVPYSGSWLAWLGRYPDFALAGMEGENSWLYQQIAFPEGMGPTYFGFYYSLESFENQCAEDASRDHLDIYLGQELGPEIAAETDQLIGQMILCKDFNTQDWIEQVFSTDLSTYAGQTLYLKILVSVNNNSPSHLFLDELFFTNSMP